jgi:DNA-directed RNA polymerase subunit K/omega
MAISETILESNLPEGCKSLLSYLSISKSPSSFSNIELAYALKISSVRTVQRRLEVLKNLGAIKIKNRNGSRLIVLDFNGVTKLSPMTKLSPLTSIQKSKEKSMQAANAYSKSPPKTFTEPKQKSKKRRKKISKQPLYKDLSISSVNLSKIKKEKEDRRKRKKSPKETCARNEIDWLKLDSHGRPKISFSPDSEERERLIEILNKTRKSPVKVKLLEKLKTKFAWSYIIYRRQLQEIEGKKPSFRIPDDEMKYAERAAEHCIRKEVTPRQVLKYWHERIGNFKNSAMRIPPLSFLSSAANIETVACSDLKELDEPKKKVSKFGNSFADLSQYDPRVRESLEKGRYDTNKYSDKYLLSVQFAAKAFALGTELFVEKTMRPMAKYLARTLYKNLRKERGG